MNDHFDPLEQELTALKPAEPSAMLTERIGKGLAGEEYVAKPSPGRYPATLSQGERDFHRGPMTYYWLAPAGVLAALLLVGLIWWSGREEKPTAEIPIDPVQPTLATALDNSLPSVWTFRPALASPAELDSLLDEHAAAGSGDPVQTRGFGPVTMDLNSRLGGL